VDTRLAPEDWQWEKLIVTMERRGARHARAAREACAACWRAAYDPAHAVPRSRRGSAGRRSKAPAPHAEVRRAVIDEWELGSRASLQHDITCTPTEGIYSVDMTQDQSATGSTRATARARAWRCRRATFRSAACSAGRASRSRTANAHVGPHSLQVAPDGSVWITLALGNQLARFDPARRELRPPTRSRRASTRTRCASIAKGRIWFTLAISNHVGVFDPATQRFRATYGSRPRASARPWCCACCR
jgi:virginiamycin B lyase